MQGSFRLDELDKNTAHRLTRTAASNEFIPRRQNVTFSVTADGPIDGKAQTELALTNRMIRVSIGIMDEFSSVQILNVNLAFTGRDGVIGAGAVITLLVVALVARAIRNAAV